MVVRNFYVSVMLGGIVEVTLKSFGVVVIITKKKNWSLENPLLKGHLSAGSTFLNTIQERKENVWGMFVLLGCIVMVLCYTNLTLHNFHMPEAWNRWKGGIGPFSSLQLFYWLYLWHHKQGCTKGWKIP